MNILVIGKFYTEGFGLHIFETLQNMGHVLSKYEPGIKYTTKQGLLFKRLNQIKNGIYNISVGFPSIKNLETKSLYKIIKERNPDLIIVTHDFLYPIEIQNIKKLTKAPIVMWFPDAIVNFGKSLFLIAGYDFLFFKDPYIVKKLKEELNCNVHYLPECCNPIYHKPVVVEPKDKKEYECDITTAGNFYSNRAALFRQLVPKYNIKVWGSPLPLWMNIPEIKKISMGKYVLNVEKAKAFQSAKIVLNNLHPAEIWGINVRAFEIPACGGFELISWRPGLNELYNDGTEIISYKTYNDLIEKIDYYLFNELERKKIIDAGMKRTHKEHTYEKRLKLLLDTVFNNKKGFETQII